MEAELWFEEFVPSFSNRMTDVKRWELPVCVTIEQVYETYCGSTDNPLSHTHFRYMWKKGFKDVIIPKVQ